MRSSASPCWPAPGPARERLRSALNEVGADIVLEDDPAAIDAQTVTDAAPEVVLVALEPAIEDSLARFDAVLDDPAIAVLFEEAELAARRDGWEARRWARHLAAKINGHDDVLPPGREEDASLALEPGLPPTPAQMHADAAIEPHVHEAVDRAWELPDDDFAYRPPSAAAQSAVVDADEWLRGATSKEELPAETPLPPPRPPAIEPVWDLALEPVTTEPAPSSPASPSVPPSLLDGTRPRRSGNCHWNRWSRPRRAAVRARPARCWCSPASAARMRYASCWPSSRPISAVRWSSTSSWMADAMTTWCGRWRASRRCR